MTSGGRRNNSGPAKSPTSLRTAKLDLTVTVLPAEGHDGEVPEFPLMARRVMRWEFEDKRKFQVLDEEETAAVAEREQELWAQVWTYPQAAAWELEPWRWNTVAMWVRTFVICESSEATAADKSSVHRFADQIGLTPSGLTENAWQVARDQLGKKRAEQADEKAAEPAQSSARDRFKVVDGTGGA